MPPRTDSALAALAELGFGPDACLMRDPRVFVDAHFLGALILEFDDELGPEEAARSLFQIGLLHGLRDAQRASGALYAEPPKGSSGLQPAPLAIRFGGCVQARGSGVALAGQWPEHHEATAFTGKLGPADAPVCHLSAGYTSGWLSGTMELDVLALEQACAGSGDGSCRFEAHELRHWQEADAARIDDMLGGLSLATYRQVASASLDAEEEGVAASRSAGAAMGEPEASAPVVHIWGPVMVMPFTGPEEALHAVDLLSRDASTGEVRAVVLDLRNSHVEAGFGMQALEQVLDVIELWGAEAVITGVSPLSEVSVHECEERHLLVRKDLAEAIATAFQIADAQRFSL